MKIEFNLSNKVHEEWINTREDDYIKVKDVKEFIKRLKEAVRWKCGTHTDNGQFWLEKINKLAGDELI